MLYTFGDSYTFGFNFYKEKLKDRNTLLYPVILGSKLNIPVLNISYPAVSNWWIARQVFSANITQNDYVVIGWTSASRFEFSVSKSTLTPKDKVIPLEKLINPEVLFPNFEKDFDTFYAHDIIEKNDDLYTRRYQLWIAQHLEKSKSKIGTHMQSMFTDHLDNNWLDLMSYMLICSTIQKLQSIKCKFIMFNVFRGFHDCNFDVDLLNIPEYMLGPKDNVLRFLRNYPSYKFEDNKIYMKHEMDSYYTKEEHESIANLLYEQLKGQHT